MQPPHDANADDDDYDDDDGDGTQNEIGQSVIWLMKISYYSAEKQISYLCAHT